ncbi:MAG: hypothetical protein KBT34_10570 [Prevotella sp.]|nr:hypothetical protein [Candidatus Prevotella equi]
MKFKIRVCNGCDPTRIASASIRGSSRGFGGGVNAVELMSNDYVPCLRCLNGFVVIYEPSNENTH